MVVEIKGCGDDTVLIEVDYTAEILTKMDVGYYVQWKEFNES